jgi:hypothetical protein
MPLRLLATRPLHRPQVPVGQTEQRTAANQLREGAWAALVERIAIQLHDIAIWEICTPREGMSILDEGYNEFSSGRVKMIKKCETLQLIVYIEDWNKSQMVPARHLKITELV